MSPSTRTGGPGQDASAARAFLRVGFPSLLPKLHRYATATLHLADMDDERAGVVEAFDLVHTLVAKALEGTLTWTLSEDATEDQIVGHACKRLYWMRSTLRIKAALTACDDDALDALDALPDEGPGPLELLVEHRGRADVVRAFEQDAEASAYVREMLAGKTRAEIVDALCSSDKHADVVRKRIIRKLTALCARMNDESESEAEPPSSGPQGSYHAPQATEERQGAPPEPHRGAGGAGRRR